MTAAARKALPRKRLAGIARAYTAEHPGQDGKAPGKRDRNDAAMGWLRVWLDGNGGPPDMSGPARGIIPDALMIGAASARASASGKDDADTGGWTPGDTAAAARIAEALGLGALLARLLHGGAGAGPAGIAAIEEAAELAEAGDAAALDAIGQAMTDGYLRVISRVLGGWDPEDAAEELTAMLEEAVADGAYAEALAVTEITTVSGVGALSVYLTMNGMLLAWVNPIDERTCRRCLSNAAADPRPAGIAWPSGDLTAPIHDRCRCGLVNAGAYIAGPDG